MSNYSSSAPTPIYPPIHSRCSPVSTHPFHTFYLCHLLLMLPSGIHQRVGYLIVQTQARQLSLAMTLLGHPGGVGGLYASTFDIIRYLLGTASPEGHHNAVPFLYVRPYNSFQYFILHSPSIISSNTEKSGEPTKCVVLYSPPPLIKTIKYSENRRSPALWPAIARIANTTQMAPPPPTPPQPRPSLRICIFQELSHAVDSSEDL